MGRGLPATAILLLAAGAAIRIAGAVLWPTGGGDTAIYMTVAENIAQHGCVSVSPPASGACVPHWGGNQLPLYPAFLAVWLVGGGLSSTTIGLAQAVLELLAIARLGQAVADLAGRKAGWLTVAVLAIAPTEWFWSRYVLTESLSIAAHLWLWAELLLCLAQARPRALPVAVALAVNVGLRLDAAFLVAPVVATFFMVAPPRAALRGLVVAAMIAGAPFLAWTVRSHLAGLPWSPIAALSNQDRSAAPAGYFAWLRTWQVNQYDLPTNSWPVLTQEYSRVVLTPRAVAGATPGEARDLAQLFAELANHDHEAFPPEIDAALGKLAADMRAREPIRHWVLLPLARAGWAWFNPFTSYAWPQFERAGRTSVDYVTMNWRSFLDEPSFLVARVVPNAWRIAALLTLVIAPLFWRRLGVDARRVYWLTLLYLVLRTAAFAMIAGVETRYIVETVPLLECLAVLVATSLWPALRQHAPAQASGPVARPGR